MLLTVYNRQFNDVVLTGCVKRKGRKEMKLKKFAVLLLCAAVMLPLAACVKKPGGSENSSGTSSSESTTVTPTKRQRYLNSRYR